VYDRFDFYGAPDLDREMREARSPAAEKFFQWSKVDTQKRSDEIVKTLVRAGYRVARSRMQTDVLPVIYTDLVPTGEQLSVGEVMKALKRFGPKVSRIQPVEPHLIVPKTGLGHWRVQFMSKGSRPPYDKFDGLQVKVQSKMPKRGGGVIESLDFDWQASIQRWLTERMLGYDLRGAKKGQTVVYPDRSDKERRLKVTGKDERGHGYGFVVLNLVDKAGKKYRIPLDRRGHPGNLLSIEKSGNGHTIPEPVIMARTSLLRIRLESVEDFDWQASIERARR
jgi:hypothetical protein